MTATLGTVTDADNVSSGGLVITTVAWSWQVELDPGTGVFTDIVREDTGDAIEATGATLALQLEDVGLQIRVRGLFEDEAGALETVTSASIVAN